MRDNVIYSSIVGLCEEKEREGIYKGSGQQFAQEITKRISVALLPPGYRKIYNTLTESLKGTGEIAEELKMESKNVSTMLLMMHRNTTLILLEKHTKKGYRWKKNK